MFRETGQIEERKHLGGIYLRILAWCLLTIAFISYIAALLGVIPDIIALGSLACLFFSLLSRSHAKRLLADDAYSVISKNPKGFVLLLRCFRMDDYSIIAGGSFGLNFEQTLASSLSYIGPVFAVGRPQEQLPPYGVPRLYIRAEDWQAEVQGLMQQARAVVLILFSRLDEEGEDEAEGFLWEIQQAISEVVLAKVLFVLPEAFKLLSGPDLFGREKKNLLAMRKSYNDFSRIVQATFPYAVDIGTERAQFIFFDSWRQLRPLRARRLKKGIAGFTDALQPFYRKFGVPSVTTSQLLLEWRFNYFFRLIVILVSCSLITKYIFNW